MEINTDTNKIFEQEMAKLFADSIDEKVRDRTEESFDILKRLQEKTGLSGSETIRRALECMDRIIEGDKDE